MSLREKKTPALYLFEIALSITTFRKKKGGENQILNDVSGTFSPRKLTAILVKPSFIR